MRKFWYWYKKACKNAAVVYYAAKDDTVSIRLKTPDMDCACPIVLACHARTGITYACSQFDKAAKHLGLTEEQSIAIVRAADAIGKLDIKFRERLLKPFTS